MATIQGENIADLVKATLNDLGRMKFTDLTSTIQEYIAVRNLMRKGKMNFQSGTEMEFNVMVEDQGNARMVGLFNQDSVNIVDGLLKGKTAWKHATEAYGYDEREILMNRSPGKIIDLLGGRRFGSAVAGVKMMELQFWNKKSSSTDTLNADGVPSWIVYNATDGFTGAAGYGSTVGNLATTIGPSGDSWKNYSFTYAAVTKDDFVDKMETAVYKTGFKSPVEVKDYDDGSQRGWYTTFVLVKALRKLYEAQNDDLGLDMLPGYKAVTFLRNKIIPVPQLDTLPNSGSEPIYGIPWGVFGMTVLKGAWMKESPPLRAPEGHQSWRIFTDTTFNFRCTDRRQCIVGAISAPFTYS